LPDFIYGTERKLSVQKLNEIIQPLVEDLGYEFIGLEYNNAGKLSVLRIYIDHEKGVDVEDCATVSREVAAIMDVKDPIRSQYNLEVSSPGLERPLFTAAQYREFIDYLVKINLYGPQDGRRKFQGPIVAVSEEGVTLEQDGAEVILSFDNIAKARLVPDYDAIISEHNSK